MKIEIWSDIMCPFCYIGKRNFEKALGQFNHTENLEIEWKSFQLRPDLVTNPTKSLNQELAESKGWSLEYTQQMSEHVTQMAADSGISFHLDKAIMANTVKGHQLLHFAKEHRKQNQAKELLFKAYFTDGKNVDEPSILLEIAKELDLNTEEISKIFDDGTYLNDIERDIYEASQIGVRGVPFFVFDQKYAVSGAQDSSAFLQTLQTSFSNWQKSHSKSQLEVTEGDSCAVDGSCD